MSVCPECQCSTLRLKNGYRKCDVCRFTIKEKDLETNYYGGVVDNNRYRPGKQLLEKVRGNSKRGEKETD